VIATRVLGPELRDGAAFNQSTCAHCLPLFSPPPPCPLPRVSRPRRSSSALPLVSPSSLPPKIRAEGYIWIAHCLKDYACKRLVRCTRRTRLVTNTWSFFCMFLCLFFILKAHWSLFLVLHSHRRPSPPFYLPISSTRRTKHDNARARTHLAAALPLCISPLIFLSRTLSFTSPSGPVTG
jgi:hypothetical protein